MKNKFFHVRVPNPDGTTREYVKKWFTDLAAAEAYAADANKRAGEGKFRNNTPILDVEEEGVKSSGPDKTLSRTKAPEKAPRVGGRFVRKPHSESEEF